MNTRTLGNSGLELTEIGLGTWAIGGPWKVGWGPQDDSDSYHTILKALEGGINWIDTAAIYGVGHSEDVVGCALRDWNGEVLLATKCGLRVDAEGEKYYDLSENGIREEVELSLQRLGRDVIDLYQIHWPGEGEQYLEGVATLQSLRREGKIRAVGVSNFSVAQLEKAAEFGPIDSLQPPYSVLRRDAEGGLFPWCAKHGAGVVAYSPLQNGLLTGKVTPEWVAALPEDDWRTTLNPYFKEPKLSACIAFVAELEKLAGEWDRSVTEIAIRWVLRRREVTAAIVGARHPEQLDAILAAAAWQLTREQEDAISQLIRECGV